MAGILSRLATDVKYSLLMFFRNRQSVFFAFVFPVLFLVVFGYLFGGQPTTPVLCYVDGDGSAASRAFVAELKASGVVEVRDGSGLDLARQLRDGTIAAYVEIPAGFGTNVAAGSGKVELYRSGSQASSAAASVIRGAADRLNLVLDGASIPDVSGSIAGSSTSYVKTLLPGILGLCIMFSAVNETISVIVRYRSTGVFNKLSVTPLSTMEWNISRIFTGTVLVMLSVSVAIGVAWLLFGVIPDINLITLLMLASGAVMFVGLGMIVAYVLEGVESPNAVSFGVTLPLMLLSGSLFPAERLPDLVQFLAVLSPLTYLNAGLRNAMLGGDSLTTVFYLAILAFLSVLIFSIGVAVLMGKEGQEI